MRARRHPALERQRAELEEDGTLDRVRREVDTDRSWLGGSTARAVSWARLRARPRPTCVRCGGPGPGTEGGFCQPCGRAYRDAVEALTEAARALPDLVRYERAEVDGPCAAGCGKPLRAGRVRLAHPLDETVQFHLGCRVSRRRLVGRMLVEPPLSESDAA